MQGYENINNNDIKISDNMRMLITILGVEKTLNLIEIFGKQFIRFNKKKINKKCEAFLSRLSEIEANKVMKEFKNSEIYITVQLKNEVIKDEIRYQHWVGGKTYEELAGVYNRTLDNIRKITRIKPLILRK